MSSRISSVQPQPPTELHGSQQERLFETRRLSLELAEPLSAEDMTVQPMDDASPTKWHLAHVTWFFETFILAKHLPGYQAFDRPSTTASTPTTRARARGSRVPSAGVLTRPSAERVFAYRAHVDEALGQAASARGVGPGSEIARLVEVGINHEQQHQELLLTDILALFAANPLRPAYRPPAAAGEPARRPRPLGWIDFAGGIRQVGHDGEGFAWDNEAPRHDALIHPFRLADRLVTNGEWLDFMADGGYRTAALWLSDGWATVNREGWQAPALLGGARRRVARHVARRPAAGRARQPRRPRQLLRGRRLRPLGRQAPADRGRVGGRRARPARGRQHARHAARCGRYRADAPADGQPRQMFGDVWEWTQSAYLPYPGYRPPAGALGEYNGKFMVSQQVLRGGSCATPDGHTRATYRNFFYPHQRWQFMGLRLATEIE